MDQPESRTTGNNQRQSQEKEQVVTFWACTETYVSVVDKVNGSYFLKFLCCELVNEIRSKLNSPSGNVNLYDIFAAAKNKLQQQQLDYYDENGQLKLTYQKAQIDWPRQIKKFNVQLVPDKPKIRCQKIFYYDNNIVQGSEHDKLLTFLGHFNDRLCNCNCNKMVLRDEASNYKSLDLDLYFRPPNYVKMYVIVLLVIVVLALVYYSQF